MHRYCRSMSIRRFLVAGIAASIPLFAGDFEAPVLRSVSVHGAAPDVTLTTQVGRPYDAASVSSDLHKLWNLGRFSDIRAELDTAGNLIFRGLDLKTEGIGLEANLVQ